MLILYTNVQVLATTQFAVGVDDTSPLLPFYSRSIFLTHARDFWTFTSGQVNIPEKKMRVLFVFSLGGL